MQRPEKSDLAGVLEASERTMQHILNNVFLFKNSAVGRMHNDKVLYILMAIVSVPYQPTTEEEEESSQKKGGCKTKIGMWDN